MPSTTEALPSNSKEQMSTGVTPINEAKMLRDITEADKDGYIMRCLKELDVFINVVFLRGHLGETISSHASRAAGQDKAWGIWLCELLNVFDPNHGPNAQASDIAAAEALIQTEETSSNVPNTIKITNS